MTIRLSVSILILMDVCLKDSDRTAMPSPFSVSILILMDVCLKVRDAEQGLVSALVSILILMDVCLKVAKGFALVPSPVGFNPYFNGCLS